MQLRQCYESDRDLCVQMGMMVELEGAEGDLIRDAVNLFQTTFGAVQFKELAIASAPGRINLIGEHTDYNDGFVLPFALDRKTVIVGRRTQNYCSDSKILSSHEPHHLVTFTMQTLHQMTLKRPRYWDYLSGVLALYMETKAAEFCNFEAVITSNVPLSCGLSSSASLQMAFAVFLEAIQRSLSLNKLDRARLCQRAEYKYCNVPSGIMDHFVASCAERNKIIFLNCRSMEAELIQLQFGTDCPALIVVNSHLKHNLADGQYATRVRECQDAVRLVKQTFPALKCTHLSDISMEQLQKAKPYMPIDVFKRARHVISENKRTVNAVRCLRQRAYQELGQLLYASHASLRDDYQVSVPPIDALIELARAFPGVYGARMTGAGFGGCLIVLIDRTQIQAFLKALPSAQRTSAFITTLGSGAKILQHAMTK